MVDDKEGFAYARQCMDSGLDHVITKLHMAQLSQGYRGLHPAMKGEQEIERAGEQRGQQTRQTEAIRFTHSEIPQEFTHEFTILPSNSQSCKFVDETDKAREKPKTKKRRRKQELFTHTDGYEWRKYGQKMLTKKSPQFRNYYRCMHPGCKAKKYVQWAMIGNERGDQTTTNFGTHTHEPPCCEEPHESTLVGPEAYGHKMSEIVERLESIIDSHPSMESFAVKVMEKINADKTTRNSVLMVACVFDLTQAMGRAAGETGVQAKAKTWAKRSVASGFPAIAVPEPNACVFADT
jgi:hypothetical protein